MILFGERAVRNELEGWRANPIGLVALEEEEERKVSSQAGAQGRLCEHPCELRREPLWAPGSAGTPFIDFQLPEL